MRVNHVRPCWVDFLHSAEFGPLAPKGHSPITLSPRPLPERKPSSPPLPPNHLTRARSLMHQTLKPGKPNPIPYTQSGPTPSALRAACYVLRVYALPYALRPTPYTLHPTLNLGGWGSCRPARGGRALARRILGACRRLGGFSFFGVFKQREVSQLRV